MNHLTTKFRLFSILLFLLVVAGIGGFNAGVAVAGWNDDYGGNGHFPSQYINWCHVGTYWYQNYSAAVNWSDDTDLVIYNNCYAENVTTFATDFGDNGQFGYAYICAGADCDNGTAWGNTYTSCEARSNTYYLSNWNSTERQYNATHELGHCWSLGHRTSTVENNSVMRMGQQSITNPNWKDEQFVNARH